MREAIVARIGPGADYSVVESWDATRDLPEHVHVAILDSSARYLQLGAEAFLRHLEMERAPWDDDFILMMDSGKVIAEKLRGAVRIHVDTERDWFSELSEEPANEGESRKAAHDLLKAAFGEDFEINDILYEDPDYEARLVEIVPDFSEVNAELMAYLEQHPEAMPPLHWRKFEELLEAIFKKKGYETTLGPGGADAGVDLRLLIRSDIGAFLTIVQTRKYAPHRAIALEPVQALYANLEEQDANKGILATTSRFLPSAKKFAASRPNRIVLAGPSEIQRWLADVTK